MKAELNRDELNQFVSDLFNVCKGYKDAQAYFGSDEIMIPDAGLPIFVGTFILSRVHGHDDNCIRKSARMLCEEILTFVDENMEDFDECCIEHD